MVTRYIAFVAVNLSDDDLRIFRKPTSYESPVGTRLHLDGLNDGQFGVIRSHVLQNACTDHEEAYAFLSPLRECYTYKHAEIPEREGSSNFFIFDDEEFEAECQALSKAGWDDKCFLDEFPWPF